MTFQEHVDVLDQYKGKTILHAARHGRIGRMSEVSLTGRLCVLLTGCLLQAPPALWKGVFVRGEVWDKRCRNATEFTRQDSSADL